MATSLKQAVEKMHGARATYLRSVAVNDEYEGAIAWQGIVDIFRLENHPQPRLCYAWTYIEDGVNKFTAVLGIDPIDCAKTAVQVAIASKARQQE